MTNNINERIEGTNPQAKAIEMPSNMRMIELSKTYLVSIEKKFGTFLHKLGIDIGNYDGNLSGNKTGAEKIFKEKILPLQEKIQKEKHTLKKHELMTQLTQAVLQARGVDMGEIQKITRENGKEVEFQKESNKLLGNDEYTKLQQELQKEVSRLDGAYVVEGDTSASLDKAKLRTTLSHNCKDAISQYAEGKISKERYESILEENMQQAREAGIELEVTKDVGDYLKLGMESGTLPIALMMSQKARLALPMLPSVIGIGIWARAVSLTTGNQSLGEKTVEGGKLLGETALTIAPITGTYMAGKDTFEAYERYKNGTGGMDEVVANGIGTLVSAGFDGVTIFLVATGVGAAPAVGLQSVKKAAQEGAKLGIKKLVGLFTKKAGEESTQNVASKAPGLFSTSKAFLKGKMELVSSAHRELGTKEFIKRFGKQAIEDTATGLWDIVTLRGIRDSAIMQKLPKQLQLFEIGKRKTANIRASAVDTLENIGLVKRGNAEKIKLRGTAGEFRATNEAVNESMRNDRGAAQVEDIHAKYKEELSTKNLEESFRELREMIIKGDGNAMEFQAILSSLKAQDEHAGNALNILFKVEESISKSQKPEDILKDIDTILKEQKGKISKSLYEYLENISVKIKNGEDFSPGSGNYLVLLNKLNGRQAIEQAYKGTPGYESYLKIISEGEKISEKGYIGHYTETLENMTKLLFSGKLSGERAQRFMIEYLDILKNGEASGWGTIRVEEIIPNFAYQFQNGVFKNGYEGFVQGILNQSKGITKNIELPLLQNIDLSLIHNPELKSQLVDRAIEQLKHLDFHKSMELLRHLSFYDDYRALLKQKFTPNIQINSYSPRALQSKNSQGEYNIINNLVKNAKNNDDLYLLLSFSKNTNGLRRNFDINQKDITDRIIENIKITDYSKLTKQQIDNEIINLEKLGDEAKPAFDLLISKLDNGDILKFSKRLESYQSHAVFCKYFHGEGSAHIINKVIVEGKDYSIEFKIRFIEELKNLGVNVSIDATKQKLASYLTTMVDDVSFIRKLDQIEYFYKDSDKDFIEVQNLFEKISILKNSDGYKFMTQNNERVFVDLIDIGRSFSDRDIKDMKNNGRITYKTLSEIELILQQGHLKNLKGEIIKEYSPQELDKIKIIRDKIKTALENYELNLFNPGEYELKITDREKINYIKEKIEEMIGLKFDVGGENPRNLNRTITKQLNVIQSNFHVEPHIIQGFIYDVLKSTKIEGFTIGEKIKLLHTLERTGIIKPSVEQKQEFIIHMEARNFDELREYSHMIKEYTKDFDKGLQESNQTIKELKAKGDKDAILQYVIKTKDDRVPVEETYLEGKDLREGIDFVRIDGKIYITEIYPARYFITQLMNAKDLKQKETYMELIHNKSDFGGKDIKYYYDLAKEKGDVETMLLMSYHDDIKYHPEVIDFLKANAKEHKNLVMYVLGKRKDYETIIGDEIYTGSNRLNEEMLSQTLTKTYIEKIEGRKLTDEEYQKIKYGIEKMFQLQKDPIFKEMVFGVRGLEDAIDENGALKNKYKDFILQHRDTFEKVFSQVNTNKQSLTELLSTMSGRDLVLTIKGYQENIQKDVEGNIGAIRNLLKDGSFRRDIVGGIREEFNTDVRNKTIDRRNKLIAGGIILRENELFGEDSRELTNSEAQKRIENNSNMVKMSPEISQTTQDINTLNLPSDIKTKITELFGNKVPLKTIFGILITFKLMTPTEAQAAAQDIEQSWKSSPEFKRFNELGGEKSAEAMKIREETVRKIAGEKLKPFIEGFDERIRDRNREKVASYPASIQVILANAYDRGFPLIQDKSQRNLNIFNSGLITYIDQVYNFTGKAEQAAQNLIKRFPEFEGSDFQTKIVAVGKNVDSMGKSLDNKKTRDEINNILKSIK